MKRIDAGFEPAAAADTNVCSKYTFARTDKVYRGLPENPDQEERPHVEAARAEVGHNADLLRFVLFPIDQYRHDVPRPAGEARWFFFVRALLISKMFSGNLQRQKFGVGCVRRVIRVCCVFGVSGVRRGALRSLFVYALIG